jgi:hypothetical protein
MSEWCGRIGEGIRACVATFPSRDHPRKLAVHPIGIPLITFPV